MRRAWLAAALAVAGCSGPSAGAPAAPTPPVAATPDAAPPDAPEASQEERLAAIQKAMNELDEAAQGCWAAVAVERFDIAGSVIVQVDIGRTSSAASIASNTTKSDKLGACMVSLLTQYRWAPPLHGQSIQLPFEFRAPADGQNVIDRRLVPWSGQGAVRVGVLLDQANSGNPRLSLFEVAIQRGGTTGLRTAERTEVWYFLGAATVRGPRKYEKTVAAGDMVYVPAGSPRELAATAGDVHAVVAVTPGGKEGSARAGALPTPEFRGAVPANPGVPPFGPRVLPAASATTYGPATIYLELADRRTLTIDDPRVNTPMSASVLKLAKGASVAEHVHAKETEVLYILEGAGTMTVAGVQLAVTPTSVIQIPPNTKHAFTAAADVRAVQIYTPAGPEQRFKATKP